MTDKAMAFLEAAKELCAAWINGDVTIDTLDPFDARLLKTYRALLAEADKGGDANAVDAGDVLPAPLQMEGMRASAVPSDPTGLASDPMTPQKKAPLKVCGHEMNNNCSCEPEDLVSAISWTVMELQSCEESTVSLTPAEAGRLWRALDASMAKHRHQIVPSNAEPRGVESLIESVLANLLPAKAESLNSAIYEARSRLKDVLRLYREEKANFPKWFAGETGWAEVARQQNEVNRLRLLLREHGIDEK